MTSPELGLFPASSDDRLPALTAAQLAASGHLEFAQRRRTEVRQGMSLEPGPQVLDGVEVGSVGRQKRHLKRTLSAVEVLRTMRLLCWAAPSQTISNFRLSCDRRAFRNSTICALLTAPSYRRNKKFERVRPATAEMCFQLKWNCTTGVHPLSAQVRTRVGRSDSPDSSMKTISRRSARHFF